MNRKKFIRPTAITFAGIGMVSIIPSRIWSADVAPSDSLNVALIGCRNMGFGILQHHLSNPGVNCVALCDVDSNVLNEKANEVKRSFNQTPKLYSDFRKMLEQKDIDAVIIGTPDHWHCLLTVYALQAGKDVYVEKPMANTIAECNIMVRAAKYYSNRIVQIGQQQRSGFIFQKTIELIKSGSIGKLRKINVWANFEYGVGQSIVPDEPVPAGVDFNMWLGTAPEGSFNKTRFHGSWRMFWDYGGGLVSDWGVHLLDIGLWAKDITAPPAKVLVYGANTYHEPRSRETDSFDLIRKLNMKIAVTYWPWYTGGPFSLDDCKKSAERLNYLGKLCKQNGLSFCWHNHDKEFASMEKGLPFDYLMNNTDSDLVKCQLDIYWARKGGADPLLMMNKYSGRFLILHIRDMTPGDAMDFECPGSGIIDFSPIFREAYAQDIRHFMVERDNVPDGMECLRSAGEYLKNLSF